MKEEPDGLYEIPKSWSWTKLQVISDMITDGSHTPPPKQESGIPMLSAQNILNNKILFSDVRYISQNSFDKEYKRAPIKQNDVLLTIVGTIGRSTVVKPNTPTFALQRSVALIKTKISPNYLSLFFQSPLLFSYIKKRARGTAQKGIYLNQLKEIPVAVAPLNEQYRIVDKIEELFSFLDAGTDTLHKIQTQLKIYRQVVLKSAFEGKLTEEWRRKHKEKIEHSQKLLNSILSCRQAYWEAAELARASKNGKPSKEDAWKKGYKTPQAPQIKELPELPEGWVWANWSQISNWVTYGFTRPMPHTQEGPLIITAKNIKNRKIDFETADKTSQEAFSKLSEKDKPTAGDILITKDGTLGKASIVPANLTFCINQSVAVVWLRSCPLDRNYLLTVIESPMTQKLIWKKARGVAIQHLSITDFAKMALPLPSIAEQRKIAEEVDRYFSIFEIIEKTVRQSLAQSKNMRQSILRKAFEGELVPQDPNDEYADKLLERIKVECVSISKSKMPNQLEVSRYVK